MGRNRKPNLKVPKPQVVYTKVAEPVPQILVRLAGKWLTIDDPQKTEQALKSIGYYRLLIYMRHFQTGAAPRNFLPGAVFSHITELYAFDRAVRLLTLDAIERLEVALRAAIINPLAELHGPHWYLDMSHYASEVGFHGVLGKIIQGAGTRRGLALSHYYDKYSSPSLPPIWLVCEKLTFGALSRFFAELKIDRRKKVARYLWTYPEKHHSYAQDFAGKTRALCDNMMMRTTLGTPLHNAKHPKLKGAKAPFLFAESLYEAITGEALRFVQTCESATAHKNTIRGLHLQLWIPPGFAHGFATLTNSTVFQYQVTDFYSPEHERCIAWNDPDLNIDWGVRGEPIVSGKDAGRFKHNQVSFCAI